MGWRISTLIMAAQHGILALGQSSKASWIKWQSSTVVESVYHGIPPSLATLPCLHNSRMTRHRLLPPLPDLASNHLGATKHLGSAYPPKWGGKSLPNTSAFLGEHLIAPFSRLPPNLKCCRCWLLCCVWPFILFKILIPIYKIISHIFQIPLVIKQIIIKYMII
jgi:hypothetical protein